MLDGVSPIDHSVDHSVIAVLLLLLLGVSIIVGTFMAFLVGHWATRRRYQIFSNLPLPRREPPHFPHPSAFFFERPNRWLLVRSSEIGPVQAALGMTNPTPCLWSEVVGRMQERKLFISPPVQGWVLVCGHHLPDPAEDPDLCFHFILRLSRALGSVQLYSLNRSVNHHAWIRAENGQIFRAYAWAGETLWNQGEMTAAERELGLKCFDYGEQPTLFPFSAREAHFANSEKVPLLAARWSIDPLTMPSQAGVRSLGLCGDLTPNRIS